MEFEVIGTPGNQASIDLVDQLERAGVKWRSHDIGGYPDDAIAELAADGHSDLPILTVWGDGGDKVVEVSGADAVRLIDSLWPGGEAA